jgi:hypothetical protein
MQRLEERLEARGRSGNKQTHEIGKPLSQRGQELRVVGDGGRLADKDRAVVGSVTANEGHLEEIGEKVVMSGSYSSERRRKMRADLRKVALGDGLRRKSRYEVSIYDGQESAHPSVV